MSKHVTALGSISMMVLLGFFAGAPARAATGVFDDCAAWWHFDYDPNANGLADTDEIRDQRDWGSAAVKGGTGRHAAASHGPLGTPAWTNDVVSPAGGDLYGRMSMAFTPVLNEGGLCFPDTFTVSDFLLTGSATIVTRFRWDGFAFNEGNPGWIYNNGLGWAEYNGWLFGVRDGSRLGMWVGQTAFYMMATTITPGVWYEAAAVLTDNGDSDTVEFYLWPQGGTPLYEKYTTSAVAGTANASVGTIIGAEAAATTYEGGNAYKAFKGAVNHIAVWDRALSREEVVQAFGNPQPLFQIGLNNDRAEDLALENEVDADYAAGDPWHTMRRAVTPSTSDASVKLTLSAVQKSLNYVFHVQTLTEGGLPGSLSLIVNGTAYAAKTAGNNSDLYWYVTTNTLLAGVNTFTLRYDGGPAGFIVFDWMELGGAWQIGYDDNNQGEFSNEGEMPDDFYVTDPDWKHVERAVVRGSDSNTVIHFSLSQEMASKYLFSYTTRVIQQGGPGPVYQFPFSICINNLYTTNYPAQPDNTIITVPIDRAFIKAGENTINFMYNGPYSAEEGGGWLQLDFHRLEVKEWPKGTLIRML